MKKYYLTDGSKSIGPFDTEDLRQRNIGQKTMVWYAGLPGWKKAGDVEDLSVLFDSSNTPPPFKSVTIHTDHDARPLPSHQRKSHVGTILITVCVFILIGIAALILTNNPNVIPNIKLEVNTPKPNIVTSRADERESDLLKRRSTVYATVINQGGDGNVLVDFHVMQNGHQYDRTQSVFLTTGESKDMRVTFDEVKMLGGTITYNVETRAQ